MGLRRILLIAALACAACASSGFDGRVYHDADVRFRVGPVPASWRALELEGARLAFRDDSESATVAVNGRCGVDGDDVPLASLTQHLFLQFTEREPVSQAPLALDGREALRTEIVAKLDGVKKRFVVYVLKKNDCVYDFLYIAPVPGSAAAGQGSLTEFERFVAGFAALE